MTPCPHPDALLVETKCYWCCKQAAVNGHRSKLTLEQLQFCGFELAPPPEPGWRPAWTILPALDGTEGHDPEVRGIRYTMRAPGHADQLEFIA